MLIRKNSSLIKKTIYRTEGYGKKEQKVPLFIIEIPGQLLLFDISANKLIETLIDITVTFHPLKSDSYPQAKSGQWSLQTFLDFVDGVKSVTEIAIPYLKENLDLMAEAKITDTTHIWSRFKSEKVAGGVFSKDEFQNIHFINFEIFGLQSGLVRWEAEMINPILEIRDQFVAQREAFINQISNIQKSLLKSE